jgi:hypothetical protein
VRALAAGGRQLPDRTVRHAGDDLFGQHVRFD